MFGATNLEHHETAYGQNIRGFEAFLYPRPFGHNPAQMEESYNMLYVFGPTPRSPISEETIAGAAAYKAVRESPKVQISPMHLFYAQAISNVRAIAAREAQILLQRYPLPNVDPAIVIRTAEDGASRLYEHENFD